MERRRERPARMLGPRCTSAHFFLGCTHKGSSNSFVRVCPPTRAAPQSGPRRGLQHPPPRLAMRVFIYEARGPRAQPDLWTSRVAGLPGTGSGTQSV